MFGPNKYLDNFLTPKNSLTVLDKDCCFVYDLHAFSLGRRAPLLLNLNPGGTTQPARLFKKSVFRSCWLWSWLFSWLQGHEKLLVIASSSFLTSWTKGVKEPTLLFIKVSAVYIYMFIFIIFIFICLFVFFFFCRLIKKQTLTFLLWRSSYESCWWLCPDLQGSWSVW